jgi:hypothetical protein
VAHLPAAFAAVASPEVTMPAMRSPLPTAAATVLRPACLGVAVTAQCPIDRRLTARRLTDRCLTARHLIARRRVFIAVAVSGLRPAFLGVAVTRRRAAFAAVAMAFFGVPRAAVVVASPCVDFPAATVRATANRGRAVFRRRGAVTRCEDGRADRGEPAPEQRDRDDRRSSPADDQA